MPGYRDDYPRRRPQQMQGRGSGHNSYNSAPSRRYRDDPPRRRYHDEPQPRRYQEDDSCRRYPDERRPSRRDGYADDYSVGYRRRPAEPARGMDMRPDDEYIPRRQPERIGGEYLADVGDDRYAFPVNDPVVDEFVVSKTPSVLRDDEIDAGFEDDFDDFDVPSAPESRAEAQRSDSFDDDFDDLDSGFDEVDEWYSAHTSSDGRLAERNRRGWTEKNGFDGFEDDEDIRRAARENLRRRDDGWDDERGEYPSSAGGFARSSAPKKGMGDGKNKIIIASVCGVLALAVVVVAIIAIVGASSGAPMKLDLILDTLTSEQTDMLVGAFVDKSLKTAECTVSVDGKNTTFSLADCEMSYVGKGGNRGSEYITGTDEATGEVELTEYAVSGVFRYNRTALREILDAQLDEGSKPAEDPYFIIDYDASVMTVHAGTDGWGVNVDTFLSQLTSALAGSGGGNVKVVCSSGAVPARQFTADEIYEQAATEAADAYTTTDSAGNTVYHSEINGVEFDKSELERLIASGGSQWQVPVTVTYPQINLKDIKKYTFPDVLASYYTYYNPGNRERSHNLSLAAEHIHSMIMEPGDQFSFNGRVGERTPENGFKKAGVYAGEGTAEGYGGGICQTSSTLYYTCILANLQIDERKNHMYTVSYMQTATSRRTVYGNDATVNWGLTDFKFTNSKEYPIRIDIWAKDGILTCEIRGTADGLTADFEYETIATEPFNIKYLKDDGTDNQAGQDGYTVHVYRVVYKDGVKIDRKLESKNRYFPMNRVYYTNDLPAGFEYGKEYPQNYTPSDDTTASTEKTTASTSATESTEATTTTTAATTTTTAAPPPDEGDIVG